jgi:hypothetical protein
MMLASGEKATPHGAPAGAVSVSINNVPRDTFALTGRLIAYGGAGLTDISVDDGITLPAWLFAGIGHQDLHALAEPVVHHVGGEIVGRGGDAVRYCFIQAVSRYCGISGRVGGGRAPTPGVCQFRRSPSPPPAEASPRLRLVTRPDSTATIS